ncbi:MAG: hypothetical protein NVSMB51_01030 [Solirubrobacteraceae bacterium]
MVFLLRDRGRLSSVLLVLGLLGACWVPTMLIGGAGKMPPLWFFIPILLAGVRFGLPGAVAAALLSGVLAGPLTPDDVAHNVGQVRSDWVIRGGFFIGIGIVMASVTRRLQAETKENWLAQELASRGAAELDRRRLLEVAAENRQREFSQTLQVARTEKEAYEIVKRHVERTIPDSAVIVLNRNHSDDRLDAATGVKAGSAVSAGLLGATPDSCLSIRFGRSYDRVPDEDSLLPCGVCGQLPSRSTCVPSLVGGQVIGSVLVEHDAELDEDAQRRVVESVSQSAPVLANLRTLVVAESRAATDALTGLPNRRAIDDTMRLMVAQAGRSQAPLSAILLDLDHFKAINDRFGHNRGDDVLAAVGDILRTESRAGDFAGRYGGEEFLLLLPATGAAGAVQLAEKLRIALGQVVVPGAGSLISASFGVAAIPEHAGDGDTLIRQADRALYRAKELGRDRVETAVGRSKTLEALPAPVHVPQGGDANRNARPQDAATESSRPTPPA